MSVQVITCMTSSEQALMDEMKALVKDLQYKIDELELRNNAKKFTIQELINQLNQTTNKEYDC